jgi:hypothetical protein
VTFAARRLRADSPILGLIRALPARRFRDAADVAVALRQLKWRPAAARDREGSAAHGKAA